MADVDAFVWHDPDGNITAVGHIVDSQRKIEPVAAEGRQVIKMAVAPKDLETLHLTHRIDIKTAKLSPRSDTPAKAN